jgi:hypothetical protein
VSASIRNGDTIVVDGSTDLSTDFMFMSKLGGHDAVKILGSSTATWGMTKLRVALALDTTGSMADSGKLEALKDATKKLLDDLSAKAANVKDVQVAIIPFSKDVNVGPGNPQNPNWKPPEWVDWSDWNDNNGSEQSSGSSGSGGWGSGGWGQVSWNNLGQVLNCIRSTGRSGRATQRCIGSTTWVANNHNTWNGCVTDRDQNYDVANTTPDTKTAKGLFPAEQYDGCPVPLLPMGYDFKKMKDHVDTFVAKGNTNATIGLVWAWHALSQDAPLNSPPITDSATRQIIILLTDGLNTENRFSDLQQDVDARMKLACNNIKAAKPGIEVYTILVNTEAVKLSSSLLQECSTTPKKPDEKFHFVVRKSTEIQDVFKQISTQMTALRLAQ